MKLDIIIENQEEIKAMLRSLVAVSRVDVSDDVFPQKMKNEHELRQLEIKLKDPSFRKKMINYFGSLGGRYCKDVIRRIMCTTATNQLWSLFSFNGRKGKLSFESCLLCQVVMKACKKIIKDANDQKIEDEIREVLKHAPNQPGGVNYEKRNINENISVWTVRRRLLDSKLPARTPRKVPLLGRKNIMKRKFFAKNHIAWRGPGMTKKWRNILWGDETKIILFNSDGKQYVRRSSNQELSPRFTAKTVKHGGGNIMV
ncbi:uncharacterized protein LOC136078496 [Hydra vulgaris]|uniref:Uncharacterized protein LOC136078496 n=1 Tax=Hydra vulgaris TaxID=6087 RepID=A0ABM4BMN3_HYDVU